MSHTIHNSHTDVIHYVLCIYNVDVRILCCMCTNKYFINNENASLNSPQDYL